LTLRTLLAYLDDTLQPSEVRTIGQKVAESDTAQELIDRIKNVTRRRRLTVPPATGPGAKWDPNTVAEYLDNVLESDQVAELEDTCLKSDVHLAEVAACHQILTLVLGEPASVPPMAKQRMYGLVQGREAIPYRKPAPSSASISNLDVLGDGSMDTDETLLLGLPLYRKQGWFRWALPLAVVLLLVGALIAIWQAIPSSRPPLAQVQTPEVPPDPKPVVQADANKEKEEEDNRKALELKQAQEKEAADKAAAAKAKEETKETKPVDVKPAVTTPGKPSTARKEIGHYAFADGRPGILLERAPQAERWQRVRNESKIHSADRFVNLPGYRSELRLDSQVLLTLWGNVPEQLPNVPLFESGVVIHAPPESFDADVTLERGRLVVANRKPMAAARVRLRFHEEVWDFTLEPESEVGVELFGMPMQAAHAKGGEEPFARLFLFVLKGKAGIKIGYKEYPNMQAPPGLGFLSWDNIGEGVKNPVVVPQLPPEWNTIPPPPQSDAMRKASDSMRIALTELNGVMTDKSAVEIKLMEALQSDKQSSRMLAVYCLAAVDDIPDVLDALADEKYLDVRMAAVVSLQQWLGRSKEQYKKLEMLLEEKKYSPTQVDVMLQLLLGFTREQLKPETFQYMIQQLKHDKLAIRHLAIHFLQQVVPEGAKIGYDAAGPTDVRQRAIEEWRKLIPEGKMPMPPMRSGEAPMQK
jgi:hypothetical protein